MQGMAALSLFRFGSREKANEIIASIKEHSIDSEEMGMYWNEFANGGHYWYNASIEAQALMIEAFDEITADKEAVEKMKLCF